jgi:hypothetical protein
VVRACLAAILVLLVGTATALTVGYDRTTLGPGVVEERPGNDTVVSVQGFHFQGKANEKKPARLVGSTPNATTEWSYNGSEATAWFYDVDPLASGNLLVTSTTPGATVVYEFDTERQARVWETRLDIEDTHDVDRLSEDELLVANMRNYDADADVNRDRVFVYNRTRGEITWEWQVRDHFDRSAGGDYTDDWTHVNDVDVLSAERFLVSLRNMDQVVVVDRESGDIVERLGTDDDHDTLSEQHNPDYLESEDGTPTILVADSENDRVVEYANEEGEWTKTWEVSGRFNWPRDADRLPDGNTLVTDSLNQRVVEITPTGEIVWEYFVTWGPYEAERLGTGPGSDGPTMTDLNATGSYTLGRGSGEGPTATNSVGRWLQLQGLESVGERYAHVVPWIRPVWMPSWGFASAVLAAVVVVVWGLGELVFQRRRVRRLLGRLRERVTASLARG